jgi:hypothetical protein
MTTWASAGTQTVFLERQEQAQLQVKWDLMTRFAQQDFNAYSKKMLFKPDNPYPFHIHKLALAILTVESSH